MSTELSLEDLQRCFEGNVPAVIATCDAAGVPNITYLSAVHLVDDQRLALSNQFMSKTTRNLVEVPFATLLVLDPVNFTEYRLEIAYERTERRGPVFERLRAHVDAIAVMTGMQAVFRLRAADIYRVESIEVVVDLTTPGEDPNTAQHPPIRLDRLSTLTQRIARCSDLESVVTTAVRGLDELLGYRHSAVLLLDERGERLFTIASHGFADEGVGSEVRFGSGPLGTAAQRCEPIRMGHLRTLHHYAEAVRRSYEEPATVGPGRDIPVPELTDVQSRLVVPAVSRGQVMGVLVVESELTVAFDEDDEAAL